MPQRAKRISKVLLLCCCLYPALKSLIGIYLEIFPTVTYPLGVIIMVSIPLVTWKWLGMSRRDVFDEIGMKRTNCLRGLASGVIFAAAILGAYYAFFKQAIDPKPIVDKVESLGLVGYRYWLMAVVISFWNSFAEEYYWRAFVLGQSRGHTGNVWLLCLGNGMLFGAHHVLILLRMFPLSLVAFFTFGTVVAGAVWSWQRIRGHSTIDCYVSHILADLAGLWAGWDLMMSA